MSYLCLVLLSLLCAAGIQCYGMNEHRMEKLVVLSVVHYISYYVIVSGLLFLIDFYSIFYAVIFTFLLLLTLLAIIFFHKKVRILGVDIHSEFRCSYLSYAVIFILVLFNWGNFEFFGMGQDQGVYQTEAINLYYGMPLKGVTVNEYDELWDSEYKDYYEDFVHKLGGYDVLTYSVNVPGINENDIKSDVEGHWHGIPTYASVLGLSAKIFGISNMQMIGTIFFACFLCMMEFILLNYQINPFIRVLCILLAGLSPEIIWVKKSTLTEGVISLFIVAYLYYMSSKTDKGHIVSVLFIIAFSYFHVTIFTMMPIFIVNYWVLFLRNKNRNYLMCVIAVLFGYVSGFYMMWSTSPRYTLMNYKNGLFFVPLAYIPYLVIVASVLAWIVNAAILKWHISIQDNLIRRVVKYTCLLGIGFICLQAIRNQYSYDECIRLTVVCYSVLSGIALFPMLVLKICSKKYEMNDCVFVLLSMFIWCILIYSSVMRLEVPSYYYYGRYLAPYLSIILILFAVLYKNCYFQATCFMLGIISLFPYANTLRINQDDSRMEWDVLEDVINYAKDATCVLMEPEVTHMLYFPVKAATGVKVYPIMDTMDETMQYIPDQNKSRCIYISRNEVGKRNRWLNLLYRNKSKFQEEDHNYLSDITSLPTKINYKGEYEISVYQRENETSLIKSSSNNAFISGWNGQNTSGYRWTLGNEATIQCFLKKVDYRMIIHDGDLIPFGQISKDKIEVKVYVNHGYIGLINFTEELNGKAHVISIPKDVINDGYNEITFQCDTWSPAEYGNSDKSNYGFSVKDIQFKEEGTTVISAKSQMPFLKGWSTVNQSGYRWMNQNISMVQCNLESSNYIMKIECGDIIPFGQISETEIKVAVYINGVFVQELAYRKENRYEPHQISIKQELLRDGSNEILFQYNTWSPAEYGSDDQNKYGISIKNICFIKEDG